ncbi:secretoglobin family 2B member 24 precursor [Mus musculus]|uniref:Secretoglobin family 2B member 24 n=3 Tax=Mus musculus TaxID=10090 RepID=S2B24_MOUSE|eukprot:NP_803229.1 secretoglobin family 2B member 24 precursor [Mus musculus]
MKGTLLLLALLMIGELGFHTTEACVPFFAGYAGVISGSRLWLYHELSAFNGTPKETVAYEKIQDCYKEQGVKSQTLEPQILASILVTPECLQYYSEETFTKIKDALKKISQH